MRRHLPNISAAGQSLGKRNAVPSAPLGPRELPGKPQATGTLMGSPAPLIVVNFVLTDADTSITKPATGTCAAAPKWSLGNRTFESTMSRKFAVALVVLAGLAWPAGHLQAAPAMSVSPPWGISRHESAQGAAAAAPVVRDIALQSGGTLHGQVVDGEGMAQANFEVWVTREDGPSLRTRTDAHGRFVVAELPAGDYRIETAAGGGKFRLWAPKTAPKDAQSNVLLVVRTRLAG